MRTSPESFIGRFSFAGTQGHRIKLLYCYTAPISCTSSSEINLKVLYRGFFVLLVGDPSISYGEGIQWPCRSPDLIPLWTIEYIRMGLCRNYFDRKELVDGQ